MINASINFNGFTKNLLRLVLLLLLVNRFTASQNFDSSTSDWEAPNSKSAVLKKINRSLVLTNDFNGQDQLLRSLTMTALSELIEDRFTHCSLALAVNNGISILLSDYPAEQSASQTPFQLKMNGQAILIIHQADVAHQGIKLRISQHIHLFRAKLVNSKIATKPVILDDSKACPTIEESWLDQFYFSRAITAINNRIDQLEYLHRQINRSRSEEYLYNRFLEVMAENDLYGVFAPRDAGVFDQHSWRPNPTDIFYLIFTPPNWSGELSLYSPIHPRDFKQQTTTLDVKIKAFFAFCHTLQFAESYMPFYKSVVAAQRPEVQRLIFPEILNYKSEPNSRNLYTILGTVSLLVASFIFLLRKKCYPCVNRGLRIQSLSTIKITSKKQHVRGNPNRFLSANHKGTDTSRLKQRFKF